MQDTPSAKTTCCMQRCLSMQQDFLDEKPRIQTLIEVAEHCCIFLPKFHCELNPIEMYWGYAKHRESFEIPIPIPFHAYIDIYTTGFREKCDRTLQKIRKLFP